MSTLKVKIKNKIWNSIVSNIYNTTLYPLLYKSVWHTIFSKQSSTAIHHINYFSANPNPGAGIGHQMANWIAGYWFAKKFELKFAHIPFASSSWEKFLGFGEDEISVQKLVQEHGYKKVYLPLFDEKNSDEIVRTKKIIKSYRDQKVVFIAEQDQFYRTQFGVMEDIKRKFYNAKMRKENKLIYDKDHFNIALHIRRGDIVEGKDKGNPNLTMRWQEQDYFKKVLKHVLKIIGIEKSIIEVYLFSQGDQEDFTEFDVFDNIHFCLDGDMGAQQAFLHMVYADLLITSKSSFSYKPALLSNGIKICPKDFWHGYPKTVGWLLADKDGMFNTQQLSKVLR